jgi:hypothetical protein
MKYEEIDAREFNLAANDTGALESANDSADVSEIEIGSEEPANADAESEISFEAVEAEAPAAELVAIPEIDIAAQGEPVVTAAKRKKKFKIGVSWAAFGGGLASLAWVGAAIGGPISYYGFDAVMAMDPALQAGLVALAFGPSVLFWLAATAAGEAFKARRLAGALAELVDSARTPFVSDESQAGAMTLNVKNEVLALQDAVTQALARLQELESAAQRNAAVFDDAVNATRSNADYMAGHLAREREALLELNAELRDQTDTMANSIGRQVRLMREASKLVRTEIGAAEDALEQHLASFAASATVMADRTADIHTAAHGVHGANAALSDTMNGVLDGLTEATKLTDAARQSAHQATAAATETASAVRETTQRAVVEAKRAAEAIRAETIALQDAAGETLARLAAAANAARAASEESQAAADRHAASIEKRLAALAQTAKAANRPVQKAEAEAVKREAKVERKAPQPVQVHSEQEEAQGLYAVAAQARAQAGGNASASVGHAEARQSRVMSGAKGFTGWGSMFAMPEQREPAKAAPAPEAADAFALVDFGASRRDPDQVLKADAIDLIRVAGVDLSRAFQPADLDRIAQRSREGAASRRRAVIEAASGAVQRVARHIKRDADAKLVAGEFRARPDLAKGDKSAQGAELVRAYLLIDTALA